MHYIRSGASMERFTSFEGNTGPYILYTIVRIKSLFAKSKELGYVVYICITYALVPQYPEALLLFQVYFPQGS